MQYSTQQRRLLRRDLFWSGIGTAFPVIAGLLSLPFLSRRLEAAELSVFLFAWSILSFAPAFDFGVGRFVSRACANRASERGTKSWEGLVGAPVALAGLIGAAGALITLGVFSGLILWRQSSLSGYMFEALVTSLSIPAVLVWHVQRSALEGLGCFFEAACSRMLIGVSSAAVPAYMAYLALPVWMMFAALLVLRFAVVVGQHVRLKASLSRSHRRSLLGEIEVFVRRHKGEGVWLGLAAPVSLVMSGLDKFLVAWLSGLTLVGLAEFLGPQEYALRAITVPAALLPALFTRTANSSELASSRVAVANRLLIMLLAPLFLVSVAISVFAREVSEILFPAFDIDTVAVIIELLVIGVASNAIAQFAVNNLVASGYSHVPGVLQLCELPIFLVSLAVALKYFGLRGAAGIWSLRIVLDTAILLYWSRMRCASLTPPSWIYVHWSAVVVLSSLVFL